jgi:hypothetical protein
MHTELDQHKSSTDLRSRERPIYLPPAGDSLEAWRDLPYKRDSWVEILTYWVNELRWRRSFWGHRRR